MLGCCGWYKAGTIRNKQSSNMKCTSTIVYLNSNTYSNIIADT